MDEGLTIESEKAAGLAITLAALRGESIEAVVTTALRDALERNRTVKEGVSTPYQEDAQHLELRKIVDDLHHHLRHPLPSWDHSWLYDDETGLPR
jgi:hypothetical protein